MKKIFIGSLIIIALFICFCLAMYFTFDHRKNHLIPRQEFRKTILYKVTSGLTPVVFVTDTKETLKEVDSSWITIISPTKCRTAIIIDFNLSKRVFSISNCDDINKLQMMRIEQNDISSDEIEIAENIRKGKLDQTFKIGIYEPISQKRYLATFNMKDCNNFFIELVSRNNENLKTCDRYHIVQINSLNIIHKYKLKA